MARLSAQQDEELSVSIERLWCIGSTRRIAELLGVARCTVVRRARKLGLKPSKHFWTPEQDAILRELYPNTLAQTIADQFGLPVGSVHDRAARLGIRKDKEWVRENSREVQQRSDNTGRFRPGHTTWNKGKRCPGLGGETSFKPGNRPHTWVPVGTERVTKDGILQRKITDDGPAYKHWKSVHAILWEAEHGPTPREHVVVFRNGNKQDFRMENLELVSRSELMRRNTIHRLPDDLMEACGAIGRLRRAINKLEKIT